MWKIYIKNGSSVRESAGSFASYEEAKQVLLSAIKDGKLGKFTSAQIKKQG